MKRKTISKMILSRETIRVLESPEELRLLEKAAGGATTCLDPGPCAIRCFCPLSMPCTQYY